MYSTERDIKLDSGNHPNCVTEQFSPQPGSPRKNHIHTQNSEIHEFCVLATSRPMAVVRDAAKKWNLWLSLHSTVAECLMYWCTSLSLGKLPARVNLVHSCQIYHNIFPANFCLGFFGRKYILFVDYR